ncbi:MAG TPA: hypothetical protein VF782_08350 [Allosphingosinicella sp.]
MPDVAIIHAADKHTAATRLADAIAAAGFAVGAVEIGDPAELADAVAGCAADARILIWSRPLVSHALHSGDLHRIRQLRGLIEVSADGITPPSRGDDARVVSISGWRGQPFHPGWQRIHLELKRLCGPRKAPPEAMAPAAPARDPRPERTAPAAPSGDVRPQARRLMLGGGAAVLLVAGIAGAASWFGESAPETPPRRESPGPRDSAAAGEPRRPERGTEPAPATAPPARVPAPGPSEPPASARAEAEAPRAEPPKAAARPRREAPPQAAPAKKYSRKNSKVMREFCERSGRSTPQCRVFLRSVRGGEGD